MIKPHEILAVSLVFQEKKEKKKVALKKTVNQTIEIQDAGHQAPRAEVICQNKRLNKLSGASLLFYLQ